MTWQEKYEQIFVQSKWNIVAWRIDSRKFGENMLLTTFSWSGLVFRQLKVIVAVTENRDSFHIEILCPTKSFRRIFLFNPSTNYNATIYIFLDASYVILYYTYMYVIIFCVEYWKTTLLKNLFKIRNLFKNVHKKCNIFLLNIKWDITFIK